MRCFAVPFVLALLFAPAAYAQTRAEEEPVIKTVRASSLSVGVGETKTLEFESPVDRVEVETKDFVDVVPRSERVLRMTGVSAGQTRMVVYSGERRIYVAAVTVTSNVGHIVRMYRPVPRPKAQESSAGEDPGREDDFSEVWCTETHCDRPQRGLKAPK